MIKYTASYLVEKLNVSMEEKGRLNISIIEMKAVHYPFKSEDNERAIKLAMDQMKELGDSVGTYHRVVLESIFRLDKKMFPPRNSSPVA